MALELARDNIRVNALAPGYFSTELNEDYLKSETGLQLIKKFPMQRLGEMPDLDGPLLLLASDAGSFMTGAVIPVDGGALLSMS
jgi:NAD(P)-dependent dehydrogenase (short-subunit alcohol dehydrogenase family)